MKEADMLTILTIVLISVSGIMFSDGFIRLFKIDPVIEIVVAIIIIVLLVIFDLHFMKNKKK